MNKTYLSAAIVMMWMLLAGVPIGHSAEPATATEAVHDEHPANAGQEPKLAIVELVKGNERFVSTNGKLQTVIDYDEIKRQAKEGQEPIAVVLACADSRSSPELLFNEGPGQLFVIRVAGNIATTESIASAEYAAAHLHCKLIVVLGHTACGAVTAAADDNKESPALIALVGQIKSSIMAASKEGLKGKELTAKAIYINVDDQKKRFLADSKILSTMHDAHEISIVTAITHIDTGKVEWLDTDGLSVGK